MEMIVGKGGRCGWTEAVYEACFGQMEMIVGERGVDVGGQRPCTKHVSGLV